ncbi:hypothetical protein POX_e06210 [Penicillium oxalicum]|uniref:hypothetical protein n=1 Tax=Penicillium oxalicum TaxID=69781 RepID=UPI0020B6B363|nr:hypothetical protein POX_e06210 [Penicillium oxalicum]KAI2788197.1 hypothetical protein POX_e06210 [Penicillium oxalicum]
MIPPEVQQPVGWTEPGSYPGPSVVRRLEGGARLVGGASQDMRPTDWQVLKPFVETALCQLGYVDLVWKEVKWTRNAKGRKRSASVRNGGVDPP